MGKTRNTIPATTRDYHRLAEKKLPRFLFDYIDGGANDEITLIRNVADFQLGGCEFCRFLNSLYYMR